MEDIDSVPSNVQSSRQEALLYVFEDNEAVIKMILKGVGLLDVVKVSISAEFKSFC